MLTEEQVLSLDKQAEQIRETIIKMLVEAGSGHTAGPLGMADIFTAFYFHILAHDPKNPDWPERDRLILSNGHIVPVRYATMAHAGYFPIEECMTLRKFGSRLQGHPERLRLQGLETTSGPLGEGLSQASGIAYSFRMDEMLDVRRPTSDVGRRTSNISSMRKAYAIPAACERPSPKGPEVVSNPFRRSRSGCPCKREPNLRSVRHSSIGKYPACDIVAYRTGTICPLESIRRSRSPQSGFFGS